MTTCRNCKFLDVAPNKLGRVVPRANVAYRCLSPLPERPAFPVAYHHQLPFWPRVGSVWVEPGDGEGCTFWELRT